MQSELGSLREPGGKTGPRPSGGYKTLTCGRLSFCVSNFDTGICLEIGYWDFEFNEWDDPRREGPVLTLERGGTVEGTWCSDLGSPEYGMGGVRAQGADRDSASSSA